MAKPTTSAGYRDEYTLDCERVLITLLRGLGPWKESIFLIGGLVPRYLVEANPPAVPTHAGTLDVDIVIDLQILSDTSGYHTLEENLKALNFERAINKEGRLVSWRWQTRMETGALMVVELLADAPEISGGRVESLPTKGTISALNIPHASIVFDMYEVREIRAELIGGSGVSVERVKHADLVSFTCLKVLAFDQRFERKDAHDLIYCLEYADRSLENTATLFRDAMAGIHNDVVQRCLEILRTRFAGDTAVEGFLKDGPVAVARFEVGESDEASQHEARLLRQRVVSSLIERFLALIG